MGDKTMRINTRIGTRTMARAFAIGATLLVLPILVMAVNDVMSVAKSDRLDAVGGVDVFNEQREAHLIRLQKYAQQLDPATRERETVELDGQIQDLRIGADVQEIGPEARVTEFRD
jgi:hypothetical protein